MANGMEIASLFARVGADVTDFNKAMKGMKDDMTAQERGISGLQSAIGTGLKVAAGVAVTAVAGLATGIGYAVTQAADMEQGIANIAAVMQLSSEETEDLKDLIMDLGLDPNLKVSAVEAAQAIEVLGSAGLTMDEIMNGAARSTVLLANATGADFADAGAIATDVMEQFNIEAEDLSGAVDQITGVTVASKFTIDDYRLALAQAGGVAGSVGVDFEDFNAVIAATSPSFASGSDAGTSFKTFLQRLVPTTNEAKEALIELGLSTGEDVVTAFFQADGAMRPMEEIAANLKTAFGGLSEAQRIEAASTIFGTDAMRTALALADGGGEIIAEMKAIIGDVSAEESAATRMDTLRGSWEIFQGVVETLTLGIGDAFIPVVRSTVEWLTGLAQEHGPRVIEMFSNFADRIGTFIPMLGEVNLLYEDGSGLLASLTELFGVSEEAAQGFWIQVFDAKQVLTDFIDSVIAAFKPITDLIAGHVQWTDVLIGTATALTFMLMPAIGTALGALGAFVAAVLAVAAPIVAAIAVVAALRIAWENDFGGIQGKTQVVLDYVMNTFGDLYQTIRDFGGDSLKEIVAWAQGNETEFTATKAIWESARQAFGTVFTDLGNRLTAFGATAWAEFKERFPGAAAALQDAFASISAKFNEMWNVIKPLIDQLVAAFNDFVAQWRSGSTDLTGVVEAARIILDATFRNIVTLVSVSIGLVIDSLKLVGQLLSGDWAGAWRTAQGMVQNVMGGIRDIVRTSLDAVLQIFGLSLDEVMDVIDGWRDAVTETFGLLRNNILAYMAQIKANVIEPVKGFIVDTAERIRDWIIYIVTAWTMLKDAARERWDAIKLAIVEPVREFVSAVMEKIISWRDWLVDKFRDIWQGIQDAFHRVNEWVSWGRDLIQGLWDGLRDKWNDLTGWFQGVWRDLTNRFKDFFGISSPSTLFASFGIDMMTGLQLGIQSASDAPISAMQGLRTAITGEVDGLVGDIGDLTDIINDILNGINIPNLPNIPGLPPPNLPPPPPPPFEMLKTFDAIKEAHPFSSPTEHTQFLEMLEGFDDIARDFFDRVGYPDVPNDPFNTTIANLLNTINNASDQNIGTLLGAVQQLITLIAQTGRGNEININLAPDDMSDNREELSQLIAYLFSLYA